MSRQVDSSDKKKFFDLLYQKTGVYLYFISMQILQNEEDAKDAFCKTYQKTFEELDKLRSTSQLIENLYQNLAQVLAEQVLSVNPKLFDMYEVSADSVAAREVIPEKMLEHPNLSKDLVAYISGQMLIQEKICLYFYYFLNFDVKQIASVLRTSEKRVNYFINSTQNAVLLRMKAVFNKNQPIPPLPLEGVPNLSKVLLEYTEKEVKLPVDLQERCWNSIAVPKQETAEEEISLLDSDIVIHTADTKSKHRLRSLLLLAMVAALIASCAILPSVFADTREQELYQDGLKKNLAQIHGQSSSQEDIPAGKEQETAIYDPSADPAMVSELSLSETSLTLEVDETVSVELTVLPETAEDKSVLWRCDDTDVAQVTADGEVTGVGSGECEITVTSKANPAVTATLSVTVTEPEESEEEYSTETSSYTPPASSQTSEPEPPSISSTPESSEPSVPPSSSETVPEPSEPESSESGGDVTSPEG